METITLNRSIGRTRRETLGGRDYIVAPLSMLVPGVLNGSRGPLLYPPELVNRNPSVWNNMPIVVYHPMEQGKPTSARDPFIINKQGIGFVFRSRENGRAEGWFDVENTKRIDPRVYDALVKNQPMELSTGLFTKNQKAPSGSSFRGKKYVEVVRDFTPDHLAILPDQKGACSMKDGCGMLINKEDGELTLETPQRKSKYRQLVETLQAVLNGSANQPRDARGRWSGGGGGGSSGGKSKTGGMGGGSQSTQQLVEGMGFSPKQIEDSEALGKSYATTRQTTSEAEGLLSKAGYTQSEGGWSSGGANHTIKVTEHSNPNTGHVGSQLVISPKSKPPAESHSSAKLGASTDSHETVKQMQKPGSSPEQIAKAVVDAHAGGASPEHIKIMVEAMQKPGNTTKLANALTKAEGIAKPKSVSKSLAETRATKKEQQRQLRTMSHEKLSEVYKEVKGSKPPPGLTKMDLIKAVNVPTSAGNESTLSKILKRPTQNQEGSRFGKPHNTVKEKPNMAKQRQVNNEEVELTNDDREELIDLIVDNCDCEEAQDRETLNSLSDKTLSKLAINALPPQFMKKKAAAEDEEEEVDDEEEVPVKNSKNKKAVTVNSQVKLDAKTQFLVNYAERKMQEEKDALIEKLTANVSEEDMDDMVETLNEEPIEKLERMVKLLPKAEKREPVQNNRNQRGRSSLREEVPESKGRNFTGAGGALPKSQSRQVNNSRKAKDEDEDYLAGPMETPTINYAEVAGFANGNFIHRNNLGSMQASAN